MDCCGKAVYVDQSSSTLPLPVRDTATGGLHTCKPAQVTQQEGAPMDAEQEKAERERIASHPVFASFTQSTRETIARLAPVSGECRMCGWTRGTNPANCGECRATQQEGAPMDAAPPEFTIFHHPDPPDLWTLLKDGKRVSDHETQEAAEAALVDARFSG